MWNYDDTKYPLLEMETLVVYLLTVRAAIANFRKANQSEAKSEKHSGEIHISSRVDTMQWKKDERKDERKEEIRKNSLNSLKAMTKHLRRKIYAKYKHLINTSAIIRAYLYARQKLQSALQALAA
jgi:hypothetical protein